MGRLYSYLYMSVDGVIANPETWVGPYFDDALSEDLTRRLTSCKAMVLGRKTYEVFAEFWPKQDRDVPFAKLNNSVLKYVVSSSLTNATWNNSEIAGADTLVAAKQEGDLHITGSGELVRSLIASHWLDALVIQVIPILVGTGQRLHEGGDMTGLTLTDRRERSNGVISLTYEPVPMQEREVTAAVNT